MEKLARCCFDKDTCCSLYRCVKDIVHPTISKKNISDYKIVFRDDLLPVRVFYPKKVSNIDNLIIYVPGGVGETNESYSSVCGNLAIELDRLIVAIDYFDIENVYPDSTLKIEDIIKYLYVELAKIRIGYENITLMGDSIGGGIVSSITFRFIKENLNYITKEILLYPMLSGDYFENSKYSSINDCLEYNKNILNDIRCYMSKYAKYKKNLKLSDVCPLLNMDYSKYPRTLIITGNLDPIKDDGYDLSLKLGNKASYEHIIYANHGFLNTFDLDVRKSYIKKIKEFL